VFARGNNKEAVFFGESDYRKYLELLEIAVNKFEFRIHAYALMTNHVHLMVETGQYHPISKAIQWLHASYTAYINFVRERTGHLFQGRFGSIVVERDAYALELSRYIHLNPVKAGIVSDPVDYPWSSCRAYMYSKMEHRLVCTKWILDSFRGGAGYARDEYRQFVMDGINKPDSMKQMVRYGSFLGSKEFALQALERAGVSADALTPIAQSFHH